MSATSLRERLTRLGAPSPSRPRPMRLLPRGFEEVSTRYGVVVIRQDVIPLPALEPHPGNVAYVDTETTGLSGGSGTMVFAAAVARPIECGLRVAQLFWPNPASRPRSSTRCARSSNRQTRSPPSTAHRSTCLCCERAG